MIWADTDPTDDEPLVCPGCGATVARCEPGCPYEDIDGADIATDADRWHDEQASSDRATSPDPWEDIF